MTRFVCGSEVFAVAAALSVWGVPAQTAGAAQSVFPRADGTLADGGIFGPFDGVADHWDWTFNDSSYEGAITLDRRLPEAGLEHRVFWEYDLSGSSMEPPLTATLTVSLRGAPIWADPPPDAIVQVYAYPADLLETPADFSAGPAELQGSVVIVPYADPAAYSFDVSRAVSGALTDGTRKVAFRFQIDPNTPHASSQAFIDAVDSDPTTKPRLTIDQRVPGDADGDGDVDLDDFSAFAACMRGPGVLTDDGCEVFDFDADTDVDQRDLAVFQRHISAPR